MSETATKFKEFGIKGMVSSEESEIAEMLRERNLERVNAESAPVQFKNTLYSRLIKRFIDIAVSLPICIILLPIYALIAIGTFIDVGKPVVFKQTRVGKDGEPFNMIKFRSMNNKTDSEGRLLPAAQRLTKFGKFLRKTSLDELPEFWNVLSGKMSIIGPRPMPTVFVDRMSERHKMRHAVRPGLECPRVFNGNDPQTSAYYYQFESDIWYVENISLRTDIKMVFMLVKMVFSRKTRAKHANVASYFVGYDDEGKAISTKLAMQIYGKTEK